MLMVGGTSVTCPKIFDFTLYCDAISRFHSSSCGIGACATFSNGSCMLKDSTIVIHAPRTFSRVGIIFNWNYNFKRAAIASSYIN
mmetsp:Transcript_26860/g.41111  ORF Transcript_26860/g.41111 Transcript_26860/m.41111 type:complete len:85 (+) Transcript_26860:506-760(+)